MSDVPPEPETSEGAVEIVAVPGRATAFAPPASVVTGTATIEVGAKARGVVESPVNVSGRGDIRFAGSLQASATVFDWESAARGVVQTKLEEVVSLMDRAQLLIVLNADDRLMATAIKAFFSTLTRSVETPAKDVVQPQAAGLLESSTSSQTRRPGPAARR